MLLGAVHLSRVPCQPVAAACTQTHTKLALLVGPCRCAAQLLGVNLVEARKAWPQGRAQPGSARHIALCVLSALQVRGAASCLHKAASQPLGGAFQLDVQFFPAKCRHTALEGAFRLWFCRLGICGPWALVVHSSVSWLNLEEIAF